MEPRKSVEVYLDRYIYEVHHQCTFALLAFDEFRKSRFRYRLRRMPAPSMMTDIFRSIHGFLGHAAMVTKLFSPAGKNRRESEEVYQRRVERGRMLREALTVQDGSAVLERHVMRNHLEHYDERLDEWVNRSHRHNVVDMNLGPRGMVGGVDQSDVHRNLDPVLLEFSFQGDTVYLGRLYEELVRIERRSRDWLMENTSWAVYALKHEG